jgi:hypothetical protein
MKKLFFAALVLLALCLVGGYTSPKQLNAEHSLTIERPANFIFQFFNRGGRYQEWSTLPGDATNSIKLEGPLEGIGSQVAWKNGSHTVTGSTDESALDAELVINDTAYKANYSLVPEGYNTVVKMSLSGPQSENPFTRLKYRWLSRQLTNQTQQSLAALKTRVEKLPLVDFANFDVNLVEIRNNYVVKFKQADVPRDTIAHAQAMQAGFSRVGAYLEQRQLPIAGSPIMIDLEATDSNAPFEAAFPVYDEVAVEEPFEFELLQGGVSLQVTHKGAYALLPNSAALLRAYADVYDLNRQGKVIINFVDNPLTSDPDTARAELYLRVAPKTPNSSSATP